MAEIIIPFGQLAPDQASFRNPGVLTARNVIPRTKSYGPFRALTTISNALTERCLGAISVRNALDNVFVYAGDENRLYEMVDRTFTEQSLSTGGYTTSINDTWEFVDWSLNNQVIATNYTDEVQVITKGGGASGAFANLFTSANPPNAKHIGIVGQFLVCAFMNDPSDGKVPNRVQWSAFRDAADMAPSSATQSDYQDMATGGICQRIIGGQEYGLIVQQDAINIMRYLGGGAGGPIFEIHPMRNVPGTSIPNSVIAGDGLVFWKAPQGFMMLDGAELHHIGDSRIDREFDDEFDITDRRYVSAALDPINKIVAWSYPGEGASSNLPNRIRLCKYDELKWAHAEVDTEIILDTETQGYTLDGLDNIGTNIDNATLFPESFDTDRWLGHEKRFAAFNQSHKLSYFTGATLGATLETGDMQPEDGHRWQINGVRPLVDGGDARVTIASRERLQDDVSYGPSADMNIQGVCPVLAAGRYQRIRTSLSSSTSWSHITGLGIDQVKLGEI